jgi:DNA replication and repair protein RecF
MQIDQLSLVNFRNFERQNVEFRPRLNFLAGDNGHGKTNLLEAIHLLCASSSFRPTQTESYLRYGCTQGQIKCQISDENFSHDLRVIFEKAKRTSFVNGKRASSKQHEARFPLVLFSPESLGAIKDGPEARRELLDSIVTLHSPSQADLLLDFSRALKSRNRVLRNIQNGEGPAQELRMTLASLTQIYLVLSTHVVAARLKAISELNADISEAVRFICDGELGDISVEYMISDLSAVKMSESQVFDVMNHRQKELSEREIQAGSSLVGPHKHDVKFLIAEKDSRFFASQGQQRALILAVKIAQIAYYKRVYGRYPILLLDDVMSELDRRRRFNLMQFLENTSAQVIVTSTDLTWSDEFGFDRNTVLRIMNGRVAEKAENALHASTTTT